MSLINVDDARADKVLLLLSTGWFGPYWPVLGLYLPAARKGSIQAALREEVRRVFVGATYWHAHFDQDRMQSTERALLRAFGEDPAASRVLAKVLQGSVPQDQAADVWLLSSMTEMLIASGDATLSARVVDSAQLAWQMAQGQVQDWCDICTRSKSSWDETVKSLTPDLPCWLADFVAVDLQSVDAFGMYWSELAGTVTPTERNELVRWYERTAQELTGEKIDFSSLL